MVEEKKKKALTELLLARLVADGGSELDAGAGLGDACAAADEDAQARLLEDVHVVVVGVAHRPAARVTPRVLALPRVHEATVPVRPVLPVVVLRQLKRRTSTFSFVNFRDLNMSIWGGGGLFTSTNIFSFWKSYSETFFIFAKVVVWHCLKIAFVVTFSNVHCGSLFEHSFELCAVYWPTSSEIHKS